MTLYFWETCSANDRTTHIVPLSLHKKWNKDLKLELERVSATSSVMMTLDPAIYPSVISSLT